ncbi:MAG: IS1182 family transposase [Clostridia bacterium]|nr:IS1182 family transposase [Clostridia bacterium]
MTNKNILRKEYTLNEQNYQLKIPMELNICIPNNDCVRLISQFVEEMDLTELYSTYERLPGENRVSPEIMLKIMLYAYHERCEISSRTIEKNCKRDINYMYLLEGKPAPDHATIARFRTKHFAKCSESMLSQMTHMLKDLGQVTDTEVFIDGTKIEADANNYTFVWKKSVTKHQAKLFRKTALLVGEMIERYDLKPLWKKQVKKHHVKKILKKLKRLASEEHLAFVSGRGHRKEQLQKDIEDLNRFLEKLKEYETKLHNCGSRNSYSKTDKDATFMHMKDDHMMNGQLKPAYNLQHAINSGYIVSVGIFPNPTDTLTLKPFVKQMEKELGFKFRRLVADAGYESEENLKFLEEKEMEAYVKPANYEQIGTKKFAKQIGRKENMDYNEEQDYYVCYNGKPIRKHRTRIAKTASGYLREETHYHCNECDDCPYRETCMPGKNWKKPVEKRFKHLTVSKEFERLRAKEYELINSEEGKKLRMNRSIQAEGSFADIKGDSSFTRYLCRGKKNVFAESVLFAMAHNLGWLHTRIQKDKLDEHLYELKPDLDAA